MARAQSEAKNEPKTGQGTEFERFTTALQKIVSVKKADLGLHQPIRPRKGVAIPKTSTS